MSNRTCSNAADSYAHVSLSSTAALIASSTSCGILEDLTHGGLQFSSVLFICCRKMNIKTSFCGLDMSFSSAYL